MSKGAIISAHCQRRTFIFDSLNKFGWFFLWWCTKNTKNQDVKNPPPQPPISPSPSSPPPPPPPHPHKHADRSNDRLVRNKDGSALGKIIRYSETTPTLHHPKKKENGAVIGFEKETVLISSVRGASYRQICFSSSSSSSSRRSSTAGLGLLCNICCGRP